VVILLKAVAAREIAKTYLWIAHYSITPDPDLPKITSDQEPTKNK
jgi:hypothetical protein